MHGMHWLRAPSWAPVRVRGASRLMQASGSVAAFGVIWWLLNLSGPVGPGFLLWSATPIGALLLSVAYWRVWATEALAVPTRRFWRHLSVAALFVGIACTAHALDVLRNPGSGLHAGPVVLTFNGFAIVVIVYALYRLPVRQKSAGELVRIGLDAGTIILATAVFMWHFQTRLTVGSDDGETFAGSVVVTVLALVAVFAVAKVVLSSYAFIDKRALRLLAIAMTIGAIGPLLAPVVSTVQPYLVPDQICMPVVFFLGVWAGERQRGVRPGPRRGAVEARPRSYSVLPYGAVAAVDGLLVAYTWNHGGTD